MCRGVTFRQLLLVLQLSQFVAVTRGKTVIVGREDTSVELPCQGSQRKSTTFNWKLPDQTKILGNQNPIFLFKGTIPSPGKRFSNFDSHKADWDRGSFPLIINKLKMEDSDTYICEVENRKEEVELWVFRVSIKPGTSLLEGQSLTMTLDTSPKVANPSIECKGPGNRIVKNAKVLSVPDLRTQDSGSWPCTVSLNQKENKFSIKILVLGFKKASTTAYNSEGELAELSFPLNSEVEDLKGELTWKAEKASSVHRWVTFSIENKKVVQKTAADHLKLQLLETLPLGLKIPQVSLQSAGSGNLTLTLDKGTLHHKVNLVVMKVAQHDDTLTCEVTGPTTPKMTLSLQQENQPARVSEQKKVVQVPAPEAGMWQCLLTDGGEVKIHSKIQVSSTGLLNQNHPKFLAVVLGGTFSFLAFIGLCILCCVKCRHQQRQAARMSQIKRLLSEKKTCQCPHRMRKTQNLI
ncbi:LOW QUALITY PROTEIN: T-cell surface glycoprotein CD4 [Acomys russatus]|uniref:LOW QUALITY PROTEIN: T-cell surface glycoprotein CD4 n=1 Tax=Acomys russatus TaxID=60746 RepID=UPI0021E2A305|nr:LOW QUALITY PROTEIN: T-cell surface glycoprotein CD4 [Acomys russatus]